jgi:hypothetical protein
VTPMVDFGELRAHPCMYCGLPCESVRDHNFVCHHREFMQGRGHRAHAICCADHMSGRDGIHGGRPCPTIHVLLPARELVVPVRPDELPSPLVVRVPTEAAPSRRCPDCGAPTRYRGGIRDRVVQCIFRTCGFVEVSA